MKMVSKNDLMVGILVLIAGIIIFEFAPGGFLFNGSSAAAHATTHYIGAAIAIMFGIVGLAMYKKLSMAGVGVSVLSVILGLVFLVDAPGMALYSVWTPHPMAMQVTGGLTALVGLIGVAAAFVMKPKK
jgi:hypothetical protein